MFKTLEWKGGIDGYLALTDQRLLPADFVTIKCQNIDQLIDAIKTLAVRGAPALGVAAAYGLVLGLKDLDNDLDLKTAIEQLDKTSDLLASSRPTAVNLFWALKKTKDLADTFAAQNPNAKTFQLKEILLNHAHDICSDDIRMCIQIGKNGADLIQDGTSILTHCNAGALATAGQGTALSPMFEAKKLGRNFKVFVDETRPLLQGSRLTAWELTQADIDATVICDNMAASLMKQKKIDMVITGADRIAANGDTANKIGTYSLSVLAKYHNIPFFIAAPSSTFDLNIPNGSQIPIEQRSPNELRFFNNIQIAPEKANVYNPAFDVVNAADITAIITEKGVINSPDAQKISDMIGSN
ncbi:MAG: S-methyl-5-thioribose-1-phosphate isomerase [Phycisphaerae bacterium]|nr:S-methyl-5-thioribose-1-phosphate isomerase [Phycisphaerae bacterium]